MVSLLGKRQPYNQERLVFIQEIKKPRNRWGEVKAMARPEAFAALPSGRGLTFIKMKLCLFVKVSAISG